jgi:hypothetical protein
MSCDSAGSRRWSTGFLQGVDWPSTARRRPRVMTDAPTRCAVGVDLLWLVVKIGEKAGRGTRGGNGSWTWRAHVGMQIYSWLPAKAQLRRRNVGKRGEASRARRQGVSRQARRVNNEAGLGTKSEIFAAGGVARARNPFSLSHTHDFFLLNFPSLYRVGGQDVQSPPCSTSPHRRTNCARARDARTQPRSLS